MFCWSLLKKNFEDSPPSDGKSLHETEREAAATMNHQPNLTDLRAQTLSSTAAQIIGTQSIGLLEAGPELLRDDLSVTRIAVHTESGTMHCVKSIVLPPPPSSSVAVNANAATAPDLLGGVVAVSKTPTAVRSKKATSSDNTESSSTAADEAAAEPFSHPATLGWLSSKEFCQHLVAVKRLSQHPHIAAWTDIIRTQRGLHFVMPYLSGGPIMNALRMRHTHFLQRTQRKQQLESDEVGGGGGQAQQSSTAEPSSSSFNASIFGNRMHEDESRFYFQQLIAAVKYAHQQDVPHGELHPECLWLDAPLLYDPMSTQIDRKSYQQRPKLQVVNFGFASVRAHSRTQQQHERKDSGQHQGSLSQGWFSRATLTKCLESMGSGGGEGGGSGSTAEDLENLLMRVSCAAPELLVPATETYSNPMAHSSSVPPAPSVVQLSDEALKRCDVWSCGAILYVFLTGEAPFPLHVPTSRGNTASGLASRNRNNSHLSTSSSTFNDLEKAQSSAASRGGNVESNTTASTVQALEAQISDVVDRMHEGEMSFPSFFSPGVRGVRHLIASMMAPDPQKRISIRDVIVHPWFDVRVERSIMGATPAVQPSPLGALGTVGAPPPAVSHSTPLSTVATSRSNPDVLL